MYALNYIGACHDSTIMFNQDNNSHELVCLVLIKSMGYVYRGIDKGARANLLNLFYL